MVARMNEENEMKITEKKNVKAEVKPLVKGYWEHLSDEALLGYKGLFIENYFIKIDSIPEPRSEESKSAVSKLWTKYKYFFEYDKQVFIAEIMAAVCSIVYSFKESQDTFQYSKLIEVDSREHNSMHGYIVKAGKKKISALEAELLKVINHNTNRIYDGKRVKVLDESSLDFEFQTEDEDLGSFHDVMGNESNAFYARTGYFPSEEDSEVYEYRSQYVAPHFKVWFLKWVEQQRVLRKHKSRNVQQTAKLTNAQIAFWDYARVHFVGELISDKQGYQETYVDKVKRLEAEGYETYNSDQIYNYIIAIRERALEAYKEEYPLGELTFLEMKVEEEKHVLQEVVDILEDTSIQIGGINRKVSEWILRNFDNNYVQDVLNQMDSSDYQNVIAGKRARKKLLPLETLYAFVDAVDYRMSVLNEVENPKVKFYKKDEEFIEGSKEKALEAKRIREEKYKSFIGDYVGKPSYIVQRVLPSGAIIEVDLFDDTHF